MAKFKSSPSSSKPAAKTASKAKTSARSTRKNADSKPSASPLSGLDLGARTIMDSAQQIWQTSVKTLERAQKESTRMFETLVKEGAGVEKKTRNLASGKVDSVRGAVENRVDQVKERAVDSWDKLEKVFEARLARPRPSGCRPR